MINSYDAASIAAQLTDQYRVKLGHHRVDVSGAELNKFENFVLAQLSEFIDDQHIQNKQLNPATGEVEDV